MRIFIVSRGVPSDRNLTLGIFEFDQAKALVEAGHDVVVLSVDRLGAEESGASEATKEMV